MGGWLDRPGYFFLEVIQFLRGRIHLKNSILS